MAPGGEKADFDKPCEYSVEREGRRQVLFLDCRECDRKGHDLNVTQCYRSALNAFQKEVNVDIITTSHHLETQYVGPSVELFGHLSRLRQDLEELANRDPVEDYKKADPKGKYRSLCPTCKANPRNIFPGLEMVLKKNPKEFINVFKKALGDLPKDDPTKMCAECKKVTVEEMGFAFASYKEMVRKVMRFGYNITVEE
jgi:hypothetical protein